MVLSLEAGRDFLYFTILVMVFPRHVLGVHTGLSGQGQALRGSVTGSESWTLGQSLFCIICSKPAVGQMQCMDLSIVVVSELGVPGGFSASVGVGQGGVCFQILCWGLVL